MEEENIEVTPSEESGNVPIDFASEETPSEQPNEVIETTEEVEEVEPTEPELYELPDGRKVDAETLSKEWKENFLPEFTRKSQTLAELEKGIPEPAKLNPLADPEYTPQTYAELAEQIKAQTLAEIESRKQAEIDQRQALESTVVEQLNEVKKLDPTVNENALFLHANTQKEKYGVVFPNLQSVYQHMKDTSAVVKKAQTTTVENIAKRNDPVSVTHGATGARPDPSQFENARDYLKSLG